MNNPELKVGIEAIRCEDCEYYGREYTPPWKDTIVFAVFAGVFASVTFTAGFIVCMHLVKQ
jgi:hypothetical protein